MMKTSRIAIVMILASIVLIAVPASAGLYTRTDSDRAERFVEIADRAQDQVENLIGLVSLNLTLIEDAGFLDDFNANVTLFTQGQENVTNAYECLALEDYDGAIANATAALETFREVLSSIHYIMQESGLARGDIIECQGLLVAMNRALDRIDNLRDLLIQTDDPLSEDVIEALSLLDEAETYLDIDTAKQWLLDGMVTETAHNLTVANSLISDAHQIVKDIAKDLNLRRINNFVGQMSRVRERFRERTQYAGGEGIDVDAVLQQLGYENMTQFESALQNMTQNAFDAGNIKDVIQGLRQVSRTIRDADHALTQETVHYRAQHGFGQSSNGNSSGNGNNGSNGNGNGQSSNGSGNSGNGNSP
ncbi:MAG: hypothetical protein WC325_01660 [Candidatus Bathyarchaeia archaeon]